MRLEIELQKSQQEFRVFGGNRELQLACVEFDLAFGPVALRFKIGPNLQFQKSMYDIRCQRPCLES